MQIIFRSAILLFFALITKANDIINADVTIDVNNDTINSFHEVSRGAINSFHEVSRGAINSFHEVSQDWAPILKDHFLPYEKDGITKVLVDTTILSGSHVVIQYINKTLSIVDPSGYCFCNNSNYSYDIKFEFHLRRCQAMAHLINETVSLVHLPDFEFVWSLDDLPVWTVRPKVTHHPMPGFGSIRCWNKGSLSMPFFGSHQHFDLKSLDSFVYPTEALKHWENRSSKAVFRGGVKRGCSFERDTIVDFNGDIVFSMVNRTKKCGRHLLLEIANNYPDLVDYHGNNDTWITLDQQEHLYRYVISAEGFGGWADRLMDLIRRSMVVFDQEHPCDQWFEPLLKPHQHYIPIAHDFRNLAVRVEWANQHPSILQKIQRQAREFSQTYLSSTGVIAYMYAILRQYTQLVKYQPTIRRDAVPINKVWDTKFLNQYCARLNN